MNISANFAILSTYYLIKLVSSHKDDSNLNNDLNNQFKHIEKRQKNLCLLVVCQNGLIFLLIH